MKQRRTWISMTDGRRASINLYLSALFGLGLAQVGCDTDGPSVEVGEFELVQVGGISYEPIVAAGGRYAAHTGVPEGIAPALRLEAVCSEERQRSVYLYSYWGLPLSGPTPWNMQNSQADVVDGSWFEADSTASSLTHKFMLHKHITPVGASEPMSPLVGVFGDAASPSLSLIEREPTEVLRLHAACASPNTTVDLYKPALQYWGSLLIRGHRDHEFAYPVSLKGLTCLIDPILQEVARDLSFEHSGFLGERVAHPVSISLSFPSPSSLDTLVERPADEPLIQVSALFEVRGPLDIGRSAHAYLQLFFYPSCADGGLRIRFAGSKAYGHQGAIAGVESKINDEIGPLLNDILDLISDHIGDPTCKGVYLLPFHDDALFQGSSAAPVEAFEPDDPGPVLVVVSDTDPGEIGGALLDITNFVSEQCGALGSLLSGVNF